MKVRVNGMGQWDGISDHGTYHNGTSHVLFVPAEWRGQKKTECKCIQRTAGIRHFTLVLKAGTSHNGTSDNGKSDHGTSDNLWRG